ncbi:MAG: hypothetical protein ASARMPREDX12_002405 [Alectoria sarmentosa]|nr:MAG: hypothetical protein ASARMPRED_005649 [Alectoria sarmentosa]CAD6569381.1 MAG: hypothetical protein ASARMPREDX12_002405 [Alectoria sarmentosa]
MGDDSEEDVGDGFLSDDSSFYGDDHLRTVLQDRAATFDPFPYWSTHGNELSVIAATSMAQAYTSAPSPKKLYNMYEGDGAGRQLSETVAAFLSRLPPLTTHVDNLGYWIYIADPHSKIRPTDEDRAGFMERGREILEDFETTRAGIEASMAGKAKNTIGRKLTPLRKQMEADLYAAAKEKGCTSGKWMLFPTADDVNRFWSLVATATATGELGHAAKVATNDGSGNVRPRLICIYTEDFSDKEDVKRVLDRLVGMGLVNRKGPMGEARGIYYKADVFTYLGIESKNEWGLKASLFSSNDVLAEEK